VNAAKREARSRERFWALVEKGAGEDACWLWRGRCHADSNPIFYYGGRAGNNRQARRLAYEWERGAIAEGEIATPACRGGRLCVRPSHQRVAPRREITSEAAQGRARHQLDADTVRDIRLAREHGVSYTILAQRFAIGPRRARRICLGEAT
jgi:hypothetical protein